MREIMSKIWETLKTHLDKQLHFLWLFFITTILAGVMDLMFVMAIACLIIAEKERQDGKFRTDTKDTLLDIVAGVLGAIAGAAYSLV